MLRQILSGEKPQQLPYLNEILKKIEKRKAGKFQFPKHYWLDLELALQCDTMAVVPIIKKHPEIAGVVEINKR